MDELQTDPFYKVLLKATQNGEPVDFGELITLLREDVSLSPEKFAQRLGMPLATLKRMESNAGSLSVDHLNAILMIFGLQVGVAPYRVHEFSIPDQVKARREKAFVMAELPE